MVADGASPARRGNTTLILATAVLVVAGAWFWSTRADETASRGNDGPRVKSTLHLDTFVLNLADTDQKAYLRVGIDVGLSKETKRGEEPPVARVRDTILGVLALGKGDDLLTAKGKDKLKVDLLHALQERMPDLGAEEIYFTEFLIQR